jgi:hypothetical protein
MGEIRGVGDYSMRSDFTEPADMTASGGAAS